MGLRLSDEEKAFFRGCKWLFWDKPLDVAAWMRSTGLPFTTKWTIRIAKWMWLNLLRRFLKAWLFCICLSYIFAYDDLVPDEPFSGYFDDWVVATLAVKLITPAPQKRKTKRKRRAVYQLPLTRDNGTAPLTFTLTHP